MKKVIVSSIVVLVTLLAVVLSNNEASDVHAGNGKAVFTGANIPCESCDIQIDEALQQLIGIREFELDRKKGVVTVSYNESVMQPEWIETALKSFGFHSIELK